MRIVAFGYKKQVGKNLSATLLKQNIFIRYPQVKVNIVSFAEQLYKVTGMVFPIKDKETYEKFPEEKEKIIEGYPCTPREYLEKVGTAMREIDPNVWIKNITLLEDHVNIVTDLRFPNEFHYLEEKKAILCRISRHTGLKDSVSDLWLNDLYPWDIVIDNNGTKQELNQTLWTEVLERLNLEGRTFTETMRH